ncbi:PAS domain S-box protein [Pedobacter sp. SYP-B3415]|uniref:PAS domain S-box protein n=1 Tax=Pedobacter sp. SYP-B3415 TaxID=2496641 RepID=UPI00101C1BFC|nr:PAS domain S-box protein [Pedobacter sp. SYP-B3415]
METTPGATAIKSITDQDYQLFFIHLNLPVCMVQKSTAARGKYQILAANAAFARLSAVPDCAGQLLDTIVTCEHIDLSSFLDQYPEASGSHEVSFSASASFATVGVSPAGAEGRFTLVFSESPNEQSQRTSDVAAAESLAQTAGIDHQEHDDESIDIDKLRFQALLAASSDVIYRMNPDWSRLQHVDGRGVLLNTDEPMEDWLNTYIPEEDQPLLLKAIHDAIAAKRVFSLEHRVKYADGAIGWMNSRAVPIVDEQGKILEWYGTAADVTANREAEQALREARDFAERRERLYEAITANTPDLIYVFDLNYRFTYANRALLEMWGKTWENAVGKGLLENGYEPWHAEMHEREIDHVIATCSSVRGEVSFPHATLGRRIYDYIFNPVIDESGAVIAIAGTTRDITEIRNAEAALGESEMRFRTMAEGSNIYIAMTDEHGSAIYFNQAWERLTGATASNLIAEGWLELLHPEDRERCVEAYTSAKQAHQPFHCDFRVMDANGTYRWLLSDAAVRFYQDGKFAGFISTAVDITDLKEDEQRKNDFISMVSHELKTPLTSTISYVQVSQKKSAEAGDSLVAGLLERAVKQLNKMTRMINSFLNVSRLESGKIHIEAQACNLASLLKEAEEESRVSVSSHTIIFEPMPDIWVHADPEKIGQVINNFISNAVKYSPARSVINVACTEADGQVKVSVSDSGIGITAADLPRIFERYYRIKRQETKNISGFGIGLYICSEIIRRHGGQIGAESTAGTGSTFYFTLPRDVA